MSQIHIDDMGDVPTVRDPHHQERQEWTYHNGDFWIRENNWWTKSTRPHITPARVKRWNKLLEKV